MVKIHHARSAGLPTSHPVGRIADFVPGLVKVIRVCGERVGLVLLNGNFYGFEDRCTHADAPLGESQLIGCEIECPRHGARFDVRDGHVTRAPAIFAIQTYEVEVVDGQVAVKLPD